MNMSQKTDAGAYRRYETVFCLFMAVIAYLWRDNPTVAEPGLLALLSALLGLNLLAGMALRRRPGSRKLAAGFVAANALVITAILYSSGGEDSNLWVLYLLPIFSASLFFGRRAVQVATATVIAQNAALHLSGGWDTSDTFEVLLQGGLFVFAAVVTNQLAERERRARGRLEGAREALGRLVEGRAERESSLEHGLNNVLAAVLGFSSVALEEPELAPELRSDLQNIQKAALKGRGIVAAFHEMERSQENHEAQNIAR